MQQLLEVFETYLDRIGTPYVRHHDCLMFDFEHQGTEFLCTVEVVTGNLLEFTATWNVKVPRRLAEDAESVMYDMYRLGPCSGEIFDDPINGNLATGTVYDFSGLKFAPEDVPSMLYKVFVNFLEMIDRVLQVLVGITPYERAIESYAAWCGTLRRELPDQSDDSPDDEPIF